MWVFCVIWNFFRRGRPLCRPVVLYLVQTYKSARNLKIFCHCEERSDVAIRFSLRRQYSFVQCKGDADSHDQFANWSRNDSKSFPRLLFSLSEITKDRRPLSHGSRRASVSLRLGHGAALTCPRHVRAAPPLHYPKRGSAPRQRFWTGALGAPHTPLRGSENGVAVATPFYLLYNIILLWYRP